MRRTAAALLTAALLGTSAGVGSANAGSRAVTIGIRHASGVYTVSGQVSPVAPGLQVTLARLDGTTNRVTGVSSTRTDAAGRYIIRTRLPAGVAGFYALTAPTPDHPPGRSRLYGLVVPTPRRGCTNPVWRSSDHPAAWQDFVSSWVSNNKWSGDAGPQTISVCNASSWYVVSDQPGTGTDDSVKTYPNTEQRPTIKVSSLPSLRSTFNVTVPPGGGTVAPNSKQWNAAYDLWLDNYSTEVMVWNTWTMNWRYWYGVHGGEMVTIDGVTYAAYTNGKGLWFVRQTVTNKGSVDLASILKWAVGRGWLASTATLHSIQYGFEVSYTGEPTRFELNNYTLSTG